MIYGGAGHRIELMRDTMHATLEKHIFSQLGHGLTMLVDADTNMDNWARGAGCLVLQDFFALSDPRF
jgi:N-acetylglucosamine repressor